MNKTIRKGLAVVCAMFAVAATAGSASAEVTEIGLVGAIEVGQGIILVKTGGENYYAWTAGTISPGCAEYAKTIDTLSAFQSLAQAAAISGKQIRIYYALCENWRYIMAIDLWP